MQPRTQSVYVIAEAGVNHDGDAAKARILIDIAVHAGADAVKFQLFDPAALVTKSAPTADYQRANLKDQRSSQSEMLAKLTLPPETFATLADYCRRQNIDFLCTPFDAKSLDFLIAETKMPYLKLASGEVTNGPFLLQAARSGLPIILSTGMSNLEEVGIALSILHFGFNHATGYPKTLRPPTRSMLGELQSKVTLLHCVSQYPAPPETSNLYAMDVMHEAFGLPVGLSDHTLGMDVALCAVARGAVMIEKHFTHDVSANGPDHAASLAPQALKEMVAAIRSGAYPKGNAAWLGKKEKTCQPIEMNTRAVARRSLVAAHPIAKGTVFCEQNLACKRPATGTLAPNQLWELLGKAAKRDYAADDFIDAKELHD